MNTQELSNWIIECDISRSGWEMINAEGVVKGAIDALCEDYIEQGLQAPEAIEVRETDGIHSIRIKTLGTPGKTVFIDGVECQITPIPNGFDMIADNPGFIPPRTLHKLIQLSVKYPTGKTRMLYIMPIGSNAGCNASPLAIHTHGNGTNEAMCFIQFEKKSDAVPCNVLFLSESQNAHMKQVAKEDAAAPSELDTNKNSYPQIINSIQVMDSEFRKVVFLGGEYQLSEQLKETFRWLAECRAIDLEHGKTKDEIESHLRDKGLIDPQASSFQVSGMFKAKLSKLGEVLKAEKISHSEYRYFIR